MLTVEVWGRSLAVEARSRLLAVEARMKSEGQLTIVETWMDSGYYRKLVDNKARRTFEAVRWMNGELMIGEVRMVLWKLGRSGEFEKTPHKVGSRKSPERVGLLRTSVGVILYPT